MSRNNFEANWDRHTEGKANITMYSVRLKFFYKYLSFHCKFICKIILIFKNHLFLIYSSSQKKHNAQFLQISQQESYMHVQSFDTRFCFVCARMCTDLYQKIFGGSLLCWELKSQVSLRSDLPLRRYLQNLVLRFCWPLLYMHILKILYL